MQTFDQKTISSSDRKQIQSELPDEIESINQLGSKLTENKLNSELQSAWISKIEPNKDTTWVKVEFTLPSGFVKDEPEDSDTFTKSFEVPDNRFPESLPFRKFLEDFGCYNFENISELIGSEVPITYNTTQNTWELEKSYVETEFETPSEERQYMTYSDDEVSEALSNVQKTISTSTETTVPFFTSHTKTRLSDNLILISFAVILLTMIILIPQPHIKIGAGVILVMLLLTEF